ncbi:YfzA family protein [Oceanobacillus luteolus]|uniref:YfzA family protein n=1 Tax=Oceanobacillus luteolus TaxID=1274358 RepID=A0ABW4HU66_9BACI
MFDNQDDNHPIRTRSWILPLGIFLGLLFIMFFIDSSSWTINFREGTFVERKVLHSRFFTDWFTPYSKSELNFLTLLISIIFLPEVIINAIKQMKMNKQK